jgi:hypothetical protein
MNHELDEAARQLSASVAAKVRPHYQKSLARGVEAPQAYALAYDKVVELVAKSQHISVAKARFASREVLQEAMALITQ